MKKPHCVLLHNFRQATCYTDLDRERRNCDSGRDLPLPKMVIELCAAALVSRQEGRERGNGFKTVRAGFHLFSVAVALIDKIGSEISNPYSFSPNNRSSRRVAKNHFMNNLFLVLCHNIFHSMMFYFWHELNPSKKRFISRKIGHHVDLS